MTERVRNGVDEAALSSEPESRSMLAFDLPWLVRDAALEFCAANFSLWLLMRRGPVVCVMEEKAGLQ